MTGHKPLPLPPGTMKVPDWYPGRWSASQDALLRSVRRRSVHNYCRPIVRLVERPIGSTSSIEKFREPRSGARVLQHLQDRILPLRVRARVNIGLPASSKIIRIDTLPMDGSMSAGAWGMLTSEQVGTEILIAGKVKDASEDVRAGSRDVAGFDVPVAQLSTAAAALSSDRERARARRANRLRRRAPH